MNEFMINKYWGFIALLCSLLLSVTLFAYTIDQQTIKENIIKVDTKVSTESLDRQKADDKLKTRIDETMISHEKIHLADEKRNALLMEYLDSRFDNMEKLINKR